uniref:Methyltransferase n=1 Tax=Pithovirus LCPAC104 TaxID=2506589 RepID=A0A481Z3N3_9VIRU|nr:MAG: methyltransferase [Pithovirus LCPAC104]
MSTNIISVDNPLESETIFNDNIPQINIISAKYGTDLFFIDVTSKIKSLGIPIKLTPDMNPNIFFKNDPVQGQRKQLTLIVDYKQGNGHETIIIDECNNKWENPICLDSSFTLDFVVSGGLSNQIYMISNACIMAKTLHRSLVYPFRIRSRKKVDDNICYQGKPDIKIDVSFSELFDDKYFSDNIGIRLSKVIPAESQISRNEKIDIRYTYNNKISWDVTNSSEISKKYYSDNPHLSALFPFLYLIPSTSEHYHLAIHTMNCLIPNSKLSTIATKIISKLKLSNSNSHYTVVHLRIEQDWKNFFPNDVITIHEFIDSIKKVCNHNKHKYIYIMSGSTSIDSLWNNLKIELSEYKIFRKEDFFNDVDYLKDLGFEENAVVDREIGLSASYFFGLEHSTMSLIIALQRNYKRLSYDFYSTQRLARNNTNLNNICFFFSDGKPLFSKEKLLMKETNPLLNYFYKNKGRIINKWIHYFDIYHNHFRKIRDSASSDDKVNILEIGVGEGGSLEMWRDYFGAEKCHIYGIDNNLNVKEIEKNYDNIKIFIGNQEDSNFLDYVIKQTPKMNIIIDDGGHFMNQQVVSFNKLFVHVKEGGIYLCEDCHTSYWEEYQGGYLKNNTFIEHSKNSIDSINAYHSRNKYLKVNDLTKTCCGIHFYDSIVIYDKANANINKPFSERH